MNLYRCFRCGWTTDIGDDDLAGDENVVAQRIVHQCRNPWSPGARVAKALTEIADELRHDEAHDPDSLDAMASYAMTWANIWRERAEQLRAADPLEDHPSLFEAV